MGTGIPSPSHRLFLYSRTHPAKLSLTGDAGLAAIAPGFLGTDTRQEIEDLIMSKRPYGKRGEKKSETLEFRLSWSEKQAFKALCDEDDVAVSARLRELITSQIEQSSASRSTPEPERKLPMPAFFNQRPRALIAALLGSAGALAALAAAPSAATIDTRAAFNLIDSDRDGQVTFAEFRAHLERDGFFMSPDAPVNASERAASESEILGAMHSEFARYDRNHDDSLTHAEFSSRYIWRMETSFNAIDRDDDGYIESRELARVMGGVGLDERQFSQTRLERATNAISAVDMDEDGRLDFAEYTTVE